MVDKKVIYKILNQNNKRGNMLSEKLLAILACPKCKGGLDYKSDLNQLICNNCRLIYKIEDDIPNMIIEEAEPLK